MDFNFLKKLLPPQEDIFYTLFEESAQVCSDASHLFLEIVNDKPTEERMQLAKTYKRKSNSISKKILIRLNTTFITPIDREDIQDVASLLNKIAKKAAKASLNLEIYRLESHTSFMKEQAENLVKATDELIKTVALLRKVSSTKEITKRNNKMKSIESKGDEILFKAMDEVFSGKYEALTVIKLKELYKNIESAMDACFDVSDVVVHITLKHG